MPCSLQGKAGNGKKLKQSSKAALQSQTKRLDKGLV
jgi:hypothetical protein